MALNAFFFNTPVDSIYIGHQVSEIFKDGVYNRYMVGKPDQTILDVGGNIGLASYYFSQYAKVVHTFEPATEHFAVLKHQIEFNKLTNVIPHQLAVSNTDGEADFFLAQNKTMHSLNPAPGFNTGAKEKVKTIRLDTFLAQEKIDHVDFMKLDVEGEEANIICGDGFQEAASKIDIVFIEIHTWMGRNPEQLKEGLRMAGFSDIQVMPNDAQLWIARKV